MMSLLYIFRRIYNIVNKVRILSFISIAGGLIMTALPLILVGLLFSQMSCTYYLVITN